MRNRGRKMLCMLLALLQIALPALAEETGPDIRHLQERLLALGYEIGAADGIVGSRTAMAVRLVQQLLADNPFAAYALPTFLGVVAAGALERVLSYRRQKRSSTITFKNDKQD